MDLIVGSLDTIQKRNVEKIKDLKWTQLPVNVNILGCFSQNNGDTGAAAGFVPQPVSPLMLPVAVSSAAEPRKPSPATSGSSEHPSARVGLKEKAVTSGHRLDLNPVSFKCVTTYKQNMKLFTSSFILFCYKKKSIYITVCVLQDCTPFSKT